MNFSLQQDIFLIYGKNPCDLRINAIFHSKFIILSLRNEYKLYNPDDFFVHEKTFVQILENFWQKCMRLKNLCMRLKNLCYFTFRIYNSDLKR